MMIFIEFNIAVAPFRKFYLKAKTIHLPLYGIFKKIIKVP